MMRATDFIAGPKLFWLALVAWTVAACDRGAEESPAPEAKGVLVSEPEARDTRIAELEAQLDAARARVSQAENELQEMRGELAAGEAKRVDREREWLEYSSLLAKISPSRLPGGKPFGVELPESENSAQAKSASASDAAASAATLPAKASDPEIQTRSLEIARALRTLFTLEQIRGLELTECGTLDGNTIGPLVLRMLDGQGHPAGSLYANRLRLEASRSAHTLTLVLEDGYETRAGQKFVFESDANVPGRTNLRRLVLDGVDPKPWARDFRELFGENGLDLSGDDGTCDLAVVKQTLNDLLKLQSAGGTYRLRALGGVQDGCLLDVHLEHFDDKGAVERRLFADRMSIVRSQGGVELSLQNGVQVRGDDERAPFLDGHYRILFPSADAEAWARAGVPGLAQKAAPAEAGARDGSNLH